MPECPKCGRNIEHLEVVEKQTATSIWTPEEHLADTEVEVSDESWRCPGCDEELFKTEEEAKKFFGKEE